MVMHSLALSKVLSFSLSVHDRWLSETSDLKLAFLLRNLAVWVELVSEHFHVEHRSLSRPVGTSILFLCCC